MCVALWVCWVWGWYRGPGYVGFATGRGRDVVRCVAGVFFLEVSLKDVDDLGWVGGYVIGGWVYDGFKLGLIFGGGL